MKRTLIIGTMMILTMTGCSKEVQAETVISTNVAIVETSAPINMEVAQTVSQELVAQASKEIAEIESLEADGKILYEDDIANETRVIDEVQNNKLMDRIRQDVVDGVTSGAAIEEEVNMWCEFTNDVDREEFIRELHLLEKVEQETEAATKSANKPAVESTKAASKPAETKSTPKQTQAAPKPTEAATPQPEIQQPPLNEDGSFNGVWGGTVKDGAPFDSDQGLSKEQYEAINNIDFN